LTLHTTFPPAPPADSSPAAIELTVFPAGPGRYTATLPNGENLVTSHQPLFAGARALAARGVDPATLLTMRHAGSHTVAMRSTVGRAAKLTVEEPDRGGLSIRAYRPRPSFAAG
jgi:hypothetical protein